MKNRLLAIPGDERGLTLVVVAAGLVGLLAATALAVDIGMLTAARTEAQRVADAAALAGAVALASSGGEQDVARARAIDYAARNLIRNQQAVVLPGDVDVDLAQATVTVRAQRLRSRGTAVSTYFARIIGIDDAEVFADATAQVSYANSINCLLPFAIPDRWDELGGDPEVYDDGTDSYVPWDPDSPGAPFTGYAASDIGTPVTLRPFGGGPGEVNPSWYYAWRPPGQQGGNDYRTNIHSCVDPTIEYFVGMVVNTEPGNMIGPTRQGIQQLIARDPSAVWDAGQKCVVTSGQEGDPSACRGSPRVRPTPLFDPRDPPGNGMKPFTLSNFVAIFVQGIQGNEISGVFVGYTGVSGGAGGVPAGLGPAFKTVRLIE